MSGFFKRYQKVIIWVVVISFFVGGVALVSLNQAGVFDPSSSGEDPTEANIAVVNGTPILNESAAVAAQTLMNQYISYYEQIGQPTNDLVAGAKGALFVLDIRAQSLQRLIQEVLLAEAADELKIRVSKDEIDEAYAAQYNEVLSSNSLTEDQLETVLLQQGRTLSSFKASVRTEAERLLRDGYLREQIVGVIVPSDDQLAEYLEANISQYDKAERIRASHILVPDEVAAQDLYQQLLAGADFAALASEHSADTGTKDQGGDLSWFERGQMVPEFEEAAFALGIGAISEPVLSSYGYHIIKLTDREAASTPTVDDIKDELRDAYIAAQEDEVFTNWYFETREAADVEIINRLVNVHLMQEEDLDAAIVEYERLLVEDEITDPYLEYYVGRSYEKRALELAGERAPLEDLEEPTEEDLAQIEVLRAQGQQNEQKALEHYLNALSEEAVDADDAFVNRVLTLDPDSTEARYILGELYADRGDVVNAEALFKEIIEDSPEYLLAYISSGDLALRQGALLQAVQRFEQATALRPDDSSILTKLVTAYLAVGYLDKTEETLLKIAEIDPGNVRMRIAEGEVAHARLSDAVAERDELLAQAERTAEDDARIEELAALIDEYSATAIDRFETALKSGGSLDINIQLGQVYLLIGDLDSADDEFRHVNIRSPYRVDAYVGLAEIQAQRGDIDGALESLQSAYSRSFDDREKEDIATRILEITPEDTASLLHLAQSLGSQYKWSAAIREFSKAIDLDPTLIEAYTGIAEAYRWRNEPETAIEYLQRGVIYAELDFDKISIYEELLVAVRAVVGSGRPLSPVGLNARISLARIYLSQYREEKALEELELVQADDPEYRLSEVNALIIEAGGTVLLPAIEEPADDAAASDEAGVTDDTSAAPGDDTASDAGSESAADDE
jgi:parvulin-like peptidyl-prolyl isomerase/Tfp pilus assembly protein PilF